MTNPGLICLERLSQGSGAGSRNRDSDYKIGALSSAFFSDFRKFMFEIVVFNCSRICGGECRSIAGGYVLTIYLNIMVFLEPV